ncbi:MAG: hypothetical protein RR185_09925 [Angelakisella sp.]
MQKNPYRLFCHAPTTIVAVCPHESKNMGGIQGHKRVFAHENHAAGCISTPEDRGTVKVFQSILLGNSMPCGYKKRMMPFLLKEGIMRLMR